MNIDLPASSFTRVDLGGLFASEHNIELTQTAGEQTPLKRLGLKTAATTVPPLPHIDRRMDTLVSAGDRRDGIKSRSLQKGLQTKVTHVDPQSAGYL